MLKEPVMILKSTILALSAMAVFTGCSFGASRDQAEKNTLFEESSDTENDSASEDESSGQEQAHPIPTKDATYKELAEKLVYDKEIDPDHIRKQLYDDFDKDGIHECFFFIGDPVDTAFGSSYGNVFFVNSAEAVMLCDTRYIGVEDDGEIFRTLTYGDATYIVYNEVFATETKSYVYRIIGSVMVESSLSGIGQLYTDPQNPTQLIITTSEYDSIYTRESGLEGDEVWMGHTWKEYYFYYDEKAGYFKEYGGTKIDEAELTKICGFDLASEIRNTGYEVDDIFKRANGIINVNYSMKTRDEFGKTTIQYKNANYDSKKGQFLSAWDTGDNTWQSSDFGGIYHAALAAEIATYE